MKRLCCDCEHVTDTRSLIFCGYLLSIIIIIFLYIYTWHVPSQIEWLAQDNGRSNSDDKCLNGLVDGDEHGASPINAPYLYSEGDPWCHHSLQHNSAVISFFLTKNLYNLLLYFWIVICETLTFTFNMDSSFSSVLCKSRSHEDTLT